MSSNQRNAPAGDRRGSAECADDLALEVAARQLVDAISAEPVPERLQILAHALGQALERRLNEPQNPSSAEDQPNAM